MPPMLSWTLRPWCGPRTRRRRNPGASSPWVRVWQRTTVPGTGTVPSCPCPLTYPCSPRPQLPCLQGHHEEGLQGAHTHPEEGEHGEWWVPAPGGGSGTVRVTVLVVSHRPSPLSCVAGTWWPWHGRAVGRQPVSSSPCSSGSRRPARLGHAPSSSRPPESWPCRPSSSPRRYRGHGGEWEQQG